jgi:ABC-type glycerol-3-phosphate transport system permease component
MHRTASLLATIAIVLLSVTTTYADIARPKPSPSPVQEGKTVLHTGLTIVPDGTLYEARLQISQEQLKTLREALASAQVGNPSIGQRIAQSATRTIIAGLFLFLSVSFAGVWLARSASRRSHKAIAAVLLGAAMLSAAAIITHANAGPPGYVRWTGLPKALSEGRPTSGGLDIQIVPEGYGMKLIVPIRKTNNANGEE